VTLGTWSARVEPGSVVAELEHDVLVGFGDGDPDIGGVGVFQGVHHALPGDMEDQQRDRCRQFDVVHVVVEADARVAADLVRE
jgi:hypothetical protein